MKKFIALLLSVVLVLSLSACGASQKAEEKAAEKIIADAIGGDVKVKIDGEKYTYKDKDGNTMTFGATQWPADEEAKFIPKFDKGTITASAIMGNIYQVSIENVEQTDYENYFQTVKDGGFTAESLTTQADGYYQYQAGDAMGNYIILSYEAEEKILTIMGTAAEKE